MPKRVERVETAPTPGEALVRAVAPGGNEPSGSDGELIVLLECLKERPLAPARSLMTEEEVEALAIRGRFEDRRRKALDAAQAVVDTLRRSGVTTRSIYLVKVNMLGRQQIEAAFAVALKPGGRMAILAPVPMAGNAKVSEVANIRRLSAARLLKLSYCDGWQVFILSTDGGLKDSEVLAPLGVRFTKRISAKDKAELMALFSAAVKVGLPAPADEVLVLQTEGWGNRFAGAFRTLKRLLPHGRVKAEIELDLNAITGGDLAHGVIRDDEVDGERLP